MNTLPPLPGPLPQPVPDPRVRNVVLDHAGMDAWVADLVLPGDASMYVMSLMETSRELIRHSYYRYEFATVAVAHSLFALERILTERLASTNRSRTSSSGPPMQGSFRPNSLPSRTTADYCATSSRRPL